MGEVKGQGHIIHPVCNRCTSFSFHINQTNHFWDMTNRVFDLDKTHPKFSKKIWQKRVYNRIPPKSNQVIGITREISLPSFVVIGWMILTFSCRHANLGLSMSQPWPWVKVTKGHPVHFPRPILSLSKISKVKFKRVWSEKQKSLRRRRTRTWTRTRRRQRTENIKSPQTGVT